MGQQQLLLIVLGVIIVGIAIVVGIQMFGQSSADSNFNAVITDMNTFASNAQGWYKKPASMAGGGRSFATVTREAIGAPASNSNGSYTIQGTPTATTFTIQGVGVEDGDGDGTNVTIQLAVYADSVGTPTVVSR